MSSVYVLLSYNVNSDDGVEWSFHGVYPDKRAAEAQSRDIRCCNEAVVLGVLVGERHDMDLNPTFRCIDNTGPAGALSRQDPDWLGVNQAYGGAA